MSGRVNEQELGMRARDIIVVPKALLRVAVGRSVQLDALGGLTGARRGGTVVPALEECEEGGLAGV